MLKKVVCGYIWKVGFYTYYICVNEVIIWYHVQHYCYKNAGFVKCIMFVE